MVHFFVLGPLQIQRANQSNRVSGIVQRASLGFLLLRPNRVVATSELIQVLWPGKRPVTARKMVQNAVSSLRRTLSEDGDGQAPMLLTHAPGYVLQIDPATIDVARFLRLADQGQAELARGLPESASHLLRQALDMWRGRALADVSDQGIEWPDLQQLETERLRVVEDYVEAELRCGRHALVLDRLYAELEQAPLRERLHGQLMLALYRDGRQVEALGLYRRLARRLDDEFGVLPGPELRELERSILNQEPSLASPEARAHAVAGGAHPVALEPAASADVPREPPVLSDHRIHDTLELAQHVERRLLSAVLIDLRFAGDGLDLPNPRARYTEAAAVCADVADSYGGYVVDDGAYGVLVQVYGVSAVHEDTPARAVRAANAVRARLSAANPNCRIVVLTDESFVQLPRRPGDRPIISGPILDRGFSLLRSATTAPVTLCETTQELAGQRVDSGPDRIERTSFLDRESELSALVAACEQSQRRARPYLVTVLGDAGMGRTRLAEVFTGVVTRRSLARVITVRLAAPEVDDGAAIATVLHRCRETVPWDSLAAPITRLAAVIGELTGKSLDHLAEVLNQMAGFPDHSVVEQVLAACREIVLATARHEPVVLVVDDLQYADDLLLEFVEGLVGTGGRGGLLVLATSRPCLLNLRHDWSGGLRRATTMTLSALSDQSMLVLLRELLGPHHREDIAEQLCALAAGNPYFAVEYAREALRAGERRHAWPVPVAVREVIAAKLSGMPAPARTLLRAMALSGGHVSVDSMTALLRWSRTDAECWLERLDEDELVCQTTESGPSAPRYTFRTPGIRETVLWQLPQHV